MKYPSVSIGEYTKKVDKWNPSKDGIGVSFDYIDLSSVCKESKRIIDELVSSITGQAAPSRARQLISVGDVLVSTVRPNLNGIALVKKEYNKGTASTGYSILRPAKKLDSKYLFYWVTTQTFISDMVRKSTGANYPAVSDKIIKESKLPLPPLPVQQKIATILDTADALKQKDKALIAKYDELSQSLFLDMFGDPVTNPKGWEVLSLKDMVQFITSGSRGWAKYYSDSGDVFLRIQNIGKNKLSIDDVAYVVAPESAEAKRTKVEANDIILSITADLGRTGVIPENFPTAHINQHLAIIRLKKNYLPFYVSEYIASSGGQYQFQKLNKGGVKAGLNFTDIKSLNILNPPLNLQNQFAKRIQAIEQQKQQGQASLQKSKELFNCLLQKAFKGELVS